MKHGTASLLTGLALTLLTPTAALAAGSQASPGYTFTRTPAHGTPGTVIHLEGTGCQYEGKPYDFAAVYLYYRADADWHARATAKYDIADDGSFSGDLTVPDDAPAGKYLLSAECYASDMAFVVADSDFTVDGSPTTTPPPTPTTPSPRPTPSRTPTPRPSLSRTPSQGSFPSRSTSRAFPSPTLPVGIPAPSSVASNRPADSSRSPSAALVMAAVALITANSLGLRNVLRRPSRS